MTEPTAGPEPAPPPAQEERPVLRRSRSDRVVAGVAGGLGRYLGIEPVLIRIALVLLVFAGGAGLLIYAVAWILMPEEREGDVLGTAATGGDRGIAEVVGIGLVVLGAFFLFRAIFPDVLEARYVWPVILILVGLAVLARSVRP